MNVNTTIWIHREIDGKDVVTEIEATGTFYLGELEEWNHTPESIKLTFAEKLEIETKLLEEKENDWQEDKYKLEREEHDSQC